MVILKDKAYLVVSSHFKDTKSYRIYGKIINLGVCDPADGEDGESKEVDISTY